MAVSTWSLPRTSAAVSRPTSARSKGSLLSVGLYREARCIRSEWCQRCGFRGYLSERRRGRKQKQCMRRDKADTDASWWVRIPAFAIFQFLLSTTAYTWSQGTGKVKDTWENSNYPRVSCQYATWRGSRSRSGLILFLRQVAEYKKCSQNICFAFKIFEEYIVLYNY